MHSRHILATGLRKCYDEDGLVIDCRSSGQDAEHKSGVGWPESRFIQGDDMVFDTLTLLIWHRQAMIGKRAATWNDALKAVSELNQASGQPWRVPSINELESLVDAALHSPALPAKHPLTALPRPTGLQPPVVLRQIGPMFSIC